MHELAITESLVDAIRARLGGERVLRVRLQVGRLQAVEPDALRFAFEMYTRGTTLDGAALDIDEVAPRGRCRACGVEQALDGSAALCRCGSADVEVLAGDELRIASVIVEES
jgi:hydrogenase nickel incorporation protein HypA/HybF